MMGILPFLIQWVALNHNYNYVYNNNYHKSHWTLVSELQQLSEDEIEHFLPQICNILIDKEYETDYGLYDHLENILAQKCASCLPFGLRVCGFLKVSPYRFNF